MFQVARFTGTLESTRGGEREVTSQKKTSILATLLRNAEERSSVSDTTNAKVSFKSRPIESKQQQHEKKKQTRVRNNSGQPTEVRVEAQHETTEDRVLRKAAAKEEKRWRKEVERRKTKDEVVTYKNVQS